MLTSCYWPGNVRELENCVERTATMVSGEYIRDLAFPCRQNRCLTQTLHFIDKADAVAPARVAPPAPGAAAPAMPVVPAAPAAPVAPDPFDDDDGEDDGVTLIGPTAQLPPSVRHFGPEPPESERDRLIWAMEQCGWVQAKAARLLRITPRQLGYALHKHRVEVRKF